MTSLFPALRELREAAAAWPEPNRYTVACDQVARLITLGNYLAERLEMHIAMDKARDDPDKCWRCKQAISEWNEALTDDGLPL